MIKYGQINTLTINRITLPGAFLSDGETDILLPKKFLTPEMTVGSSVDVFVYLDSEDRPVATTQTPKVMVGQYAVLQVLNTTSIGAFLDWGLDKDLLLPFAEQERRVKTGQNVLVFVYLDQYSKRIVASSKIKRYIKTHPDRLKAGSTVDIIVYGGNDIGLLCLVNKKYNGMLYRSEVFDHLRIGTETKAYVKKVREDGLIDLTIRKEGYQAGIDHNVPKVLAKLQRTGYMPYNDKSSAEDIREIFRMSKKDFKKAIGSLYKERKIVILPDGIRLTEKKDN